MRKFETLLLLSPGLSPSEREEILQTLTKIITNVDGEVETNHWGMKDLAYPVRKQMRGYYVNLIYTAPGSIIKELERIIRITTGIFKFLTVQLDESIKEVA